MSYGSAVDAATDGRHARRLRNAEAVVEAVREFLQEGEGFPTAQQVADRSGVSLRSVFRYFDDMDGLMCSALRLEFERLAPFFVCRPPAADASLEDRIEHLVAHRTELYRHAGPEIHAVVARSYRHPAFSDVLEQLRSNVRTQLTTLFAPELERIGEADARVACAALQVATLFEGYECARDRHELTLDEWAEMARRMVRGVFAEFLQPA